MSWLPSIFPQKSFISLSATRASPARLWNYSILDVKASRIYLESNFVTSVVKIPEIVSSVPTPKFGDFRGFFPKYPQNLGDPRPLRIPNYFYTCNPVPISEIRRFFGMNLNKSPKFGLSPSPKHPQNLGFFGDKPQKIPKKLKLQIMY